MIAQRKVFFISLLLVLLNGFLDYITGAHVSMMLLFALPIMLAAWYCGKIAGVAIALAATAAWLVVNQLQQAHGGDGVILSWNTFSRFGIFVLIAYVVSLQAQLRESLERERRRASTDRLTGLLNKEAFRERVEEEMRRAHRYSHPLSLAFIDLDDFKQINDTYGHTRGDRLLKDVSSTILNTVRKTDIAGRVGGDEFAVLFPETDDRQAIKAVQELINAFDIMTSQSGWRVTASMGVITCPEICETYDALLGEADRLMYAAKEKGKNGVEFAVMDESWSRTCERMKMRPEQGGRIPQHPGGTDGRGETTG